MQCKKCFDRGVYKVLLYQARRDPRSVYGAGWGNSGKVASRALFGVNPEVGTD